MTLNKKWIVKRSKIHGHGVFAKQNIKKGTKIIEYIGEKISKTQGDKRSAARLKKYLDSNITGSVYIFELDKKYDIDGSPLYNKARYINHSCDPNCEVEIESGSIWISSIKNINKGSELSYDYGFEFDEDDFLDHKCKCGSKKCIGFVISRDDWKKYKRYLKKQINLLSK